MSLANRFVKRTFDLICSLLGLILLSPLLLILGLVVATTSPGGAFFCQIRIGRHGKPFRMFKFRTMVAHAERMSGGSITVKNDCRITPQGKFLRRFKLDELPSLRNVISGDMSLVGPRPDVPGYADKLGGEDRRILELKPGITGPATLKYANEEELLARVDDPVKYNDEVIFPDKIRINLDYLNNWSLFLDLKIILKTIFRRNY